MEETKNTHQSGIIELSAHASLVYMVLFFIGSLVNYLYPISVDGDVSKEIGLILCVVGPLLILWSQKSIRIFKESVKTGQPKNFAIGPYRFMRNPTYFGLALLIAGFGFFAGAFYIILSAFVAFIIVNFTILRKEEELLTQKYGEEYLSYKNKVRRWL